jgi:anaerobic ribonucleoside-triphosphate reductase
MSNLTKIECQKVYSKIQNEKRTRCEIWTRTMGYMRPVSQMNIGKKQEFKDRKNFKV